MEYHYLNIQPLQIEKLARNQLENDHVGYQRSCLGSQLLSNKYNVPSACVALTAHNIKVTLKGQSEKCLKIGEAKTSVASACVCYGPVRALLSPFAACRIVADWERMRYEELCFEEVRH